MRPLRLDTLSPQQLRELDELYHRTRDVRVHTRAQMILLAAERGLVAAEVAAIVRQDEETVRRWFARYPGCCTDPGGIWNRSGVGGAPFSPVAGRPCCPSS
jgi:hypothetical protein